MPTPKQEKLIKLILENLGNTKNTRTLGELILEAGYSKSMAENPFQIMGSETIKEALTDVVSVMKKTRDKALKEITDEKLEKERAKDLTDIVDKLTKNIQLLGGKPTEIINDLSQLSDEELRKIAEGKGGDGQEGTSEETP